MGIRYYTTTHGWADYLSLRLQGSDPSLYRDTALLHEPRNALFDDAEVPFNEPYFSDRLFRNTVREFETYFEPFKRKTETTPRFMLVVSSLSEEQGLHDQSLVLQEEYLFLGDFLFSNPIDLYSNKEGGLDVFTGYSSNTYRIDFAGNQWEESDVGIGERPLPLCG